MFAISPTNGASVRVQSVQTQDAERETEYCKMILNNKVSVRRISRRGLFGIK